MSRERSWLSRVALARWTPHIVIALATCATFARALLYPFQRSWDDDRFIVANNDVQHVSLDALLRMFTRVQFEAYHPLHLLSYWLDVPWFGAQPLPVHVVSLALWIAALLILYELLRALTVPGWIAVASCLVCGLHPVQVEAVSWASGRKDVLALLLSAASLWIQLRSRSANDRAAWMARCCYGLALLAKTTAVPLPLLAFTLDTCVQGTPWRSAAKRQLPNALLGAVVGATVVYIWSQHMMVRETLGGIELAPVRFVQTLGHLLLTACWPGSTSPMYPTDDVSAWHWGRSLAFLSYVIATALAWRLRPRLAFAGLIGFLCISLPVANLVPMYFPLQDRYLSLPLLPLSMAFAGALHAMTNAARARGAPVGTMLITGTALVLLSARCWQYQGVWADELRLWGHAAHTQPASDYAWLKLGEVRRDAHQLEGAIAAYRGAVRTAPSRRLAHAGLFEAVALRDERIAHLQPTAARELAQRYYKTLDQPQGLREFAQNLMARGYTRAAELPLHLAQLQDPWPDSILERAALSALRVNRVNLAHLYAALMQQASAAPPLKDLLQQPYYSVLP